MMKLVGFLLVTLVVCAAAHESPEPPHQHASQQTEYATLARGFGDHLDWMPLREGLRKAKNENLTSMILIHKSWCSGCKTLGPLISNSEEITRLSSAYVLINVMDDEEPIDPKYAPDGQYFPRILFFDPNGKLMENINNGRPKGDYLYLYNSGHKLAEVMKNALKYCVFTPQVANLIDPEDLRTAFRSEL